LLNLRRSTWRMVWDIPWRITLKHGKWSCGSMGFLGFSRARTLIQRPRHLGTTSTQTLQSSVSSSSISVLNVLNHCHFFVHLYCDAHCLHFLSKYFTRELLPLGTIQKVDLPLNLISWLFKTSPHCMYTISLHRYWSTPHLKAGC
jgi:hypothetical protein